MNHEFQTLSDIHQRQLYFIGAVVSLIQLLLLFCYMIVVGVLGPRIGNAGEYFNLYQTSPGLVLLRVDLPMLLLVGLYLGSFPALVMALWRDNPVLVLFAALFTLIAVTLSFAGEATFGLRHLAELYTGTGDEAEQGRLLAAGEALLAGGWWNSSGSYLTGILLQGGGVLISLVMLKSPHFMKVTALCGLVGNAADLGQHLLAPFAPTVAWGMSLLMVVYLFWYPLMARDLFRLAGNTSKNRIISK